MYQAAVTVTAVSAVSLQRLQMESDMVLLRAVSCILSAQRFLSASLADCLSSFTHFYASAKTGGGGIVFSGRPSGHLSVFHPLTSVLFVTVSSYLVDGF